MTSGRAEAFSYVPRASPLSWPRTIPAGEVTGVVVAHDGHTVVTHRGTPPVLVFQPDGRFAEAWDAEGLVRDPHSVSASHDRFFVTDRERHIAVAADLGGRVLQVLGSLDQPSPTDTDVDIAPVVSPAGPFNRPTKVVEAGWGDLYASDGYRNARVHRFAATGELVQSIGSYGTGALEFRLPHALATDDHGRVYVCDRENSRVQILTRDLEHIADWGGVVRPTDVQVVGELAFVVDLAPSVTVFALDGTPLTRFECPASAHGLAVTAAGDVLVAHVRRHEVSFYQRVAT